MFLNINISNIFFKMFISNREEGAVKVQSINVYFWAAAVSHGNRVLFLYESSKREKDIFVKILKVFLKVDGINIPEKNQEYCVK